MYVEKNLWLATNFAAKMIRETGYRNKSIRIAANYYGVDEEAVGAEINKRISSGLKKKSKVTYKKFYFKGKIMTECEANGISKFYEKVEPFKATSHENACKRVEDYFKKRYGDYPPKSDSYYASFFLGICDENDVKELEL